MRAVEPGDIGTFRDQVGYLLWEPATSTVTMTLAIPRAKVAMAQWHGRAGCYEVNASGGGGRSALRHLHCAVPGRCVPHAVMAMR
jgi:hypothetical protein